jgi:hypothetical protein
MTKLRSISGGSQSLTVHNTPGKAVMSYYISGDILNRIWKTKRPDCCDTGWGKKNGFSGRDTYKIIKNTKGEYWCEWSSSLVIWASRWYEMPKIVGQRAEKLYDYLEDLT